MPHVPDMLVDMSSGETRQAELRSVEVSEENEGQRGEARCQ